MNLPPAPDACNPYSRLVDLGAIPCAESGEKIPTRKTFEDPDAAEHWLGDMPGIVIEYDSPRGRYHAIAEPRPGGPAGYVVPPGARLACIDVDVDREAVEPRDGLADLAELSAELGPLPETFVTRSPRVGGIHAWYMLPEGVRVAGSGKIRGRLGLDCKGNGGAYVGEHREGRSIALDVPIAMLPEAWLAALPRAGAGTLVPRAGRGSGTNPPGVQWRATCATWPAAIEQEGEGGLKLKMLGQAAGRAGLIYAEALAVAWQEYNPRCVPAFDAHEFDRRFGEWYGKALAEVEEAERFCASVFRDALPTVPAPVDPTDDGADHTTSSEVRVSMLRATPLPSPGYLVKPSVAVIGKYFGHHPAWAGRFRWDEFAKVIRVFGYDFGQGPLEGAEVTDHHLLALCVHYGQAFGAEPAREMMLAGLSIAALEHSYHPVLGYLHSARNRLPPAASSDDAREALRKVFDLVFGRPLTCLEHAFLLRTCVGSVRRVREPGCKLDTMLLLVGGQGLRKSSFFLELFGAAWFSDSPIDMRQKDGAINLQGVWCTEFAELANVRRDELERTRAFMSSRSDRYRAPYDKVPQDHRRVGVLVGSTNDDLPLHDPEGLRRWWPVRVGREIDLEAVRRYRDLVWGCAALLEGEGEQHHLTRDEETEARDHKAEFEEGDGWEGPLASAARGLDVVHVPLLLEASLGLSKEQAHSQGATKRAARVLRRLGFERVHTEHGKRWRVPENIRQLPAMNSGAWTFADPAKAIN